MLKIKIYDFICLNNGTQSVTNLLSIACISMYKYFKSFRLNASDYAMIRLYCYLLTVYVVDVCVKCAV